jgi:hypothetical protein
MKPSVGRIVHYIGYGALGRDVSCKTAIITEVDMEDDTISLTVFGVGGVTSFSDAHHSEDKHDCTWHWPEREES